MSKVGKTIKRSVRILVMAAMIPTAGFAFGGPWDDDAPKSQRQEAVDACVGRGPGNHIERMARKLGLTPEQKERIEAILEAEREKVEPLRRQLDETREKIRTASETEPFDEAAVRALAAGQNDARVDLVVSRARTKSRIHALLNPEQRELAKTFGSRGHGRHGHRPRM